MDEHTNATSTGAKGLRPKAPLPEGKFEGECKQCGHLVRFVAKEIAPAAASACATSSCCSAKSAPATATATASAAGPPPTISSISFTLNGSPVTVENPDPTMSLNEWLRTKACLPGTKRSCQEGGCGACVVSVAKDTSTSSTDVIAVNSCLKPLCSVDGWKITTIEGIGSQTAGYHPIQTTLASHYGSQCGYCSPGMVMNMYALLQKNPKPTMQEVENAFDGNICRCTGYRPILDAMKSFAVDAAYPASTDIEELARLKAVPCAQLPCGAACADKRKAAKVKVTGSGITWVQPATLSDLYKDMAVFAGQPYRLVFGGTSKGVFKQDDATVLFDISKLSELRGSQVTSTGLVVGAGTSITDLVALLQANATTSASYAVLASHLLRIANVPVRNAGSWAGNLMMAHDHSDFPSDVFTIMAAANATLNIGSASEGSSSMDLFTFLQTDMTNKVIISMTIPALAKGQQLRTYKIMLRHVNCHAYVNAGMLFTLDTSSNVVGTPRLVFGGISPFATLATKTAAYLSGKNINSAATLQGALAVLNTELSPDQPPWASSAEYRMMLASSLFYKTILSFIPNLDPRLQSAAAPYVRPLSSGQQSFDTDPSEYPVSQAMPKMNANMLAAGEARFVDDMPSLADELFGAFVLSTQGNCTLAAIDPSKALASNLGVAKFISAADIPGKNNFVSANSGSSVEFIFVPLGGSVDYAGQAIGMVLADTQEHANAAAKLVTATYTNIQTPILTIDDAIKAGSFFDVPINPVISGEPIAKALSECAKVISGSVECGSQYHFHMETQTAAARLDEDGGLIVYASTQAVDFAQRGIAQATGLPAGKVKVVVKRTGGAYGGKITRAQMVSSAVSVATAVTRKPVRCVLDLNDNMQMVGKRNPFYVSYQIGVDKSNKLHAISLSYVADAGHNYNDTPGTVSMALTTCDNSYYCPNWEVTAKLAKTNTPTNTATRAPGCLPAIFFIEVAMDHAAKELGISADEFRFNNLYKQGQVTPYNSTLTYCSISDLWTQFVSDIDYQSRLADVETFNQANRWRKRALTLGPNKYGIATGGAYFGAFISISGMDGSVNVSHGGIEVGQGIDTKLAQVVALELGCPLTSIKVEATDSFVHVNNCCTGGSITSELCCGAAASAAKTITAALAPVRAKLPQTASWSDVIQAANAANVDLTARGWNTPPAVADPFAYNSYGMVATEVEVDILTGEVQILRVDILFDCGQSLNPGIDIGQVEGGFVMGLGYMLTELVKYDPKSGALLTDGTWEYKPPSALDIPIDFRISLLKNAPNPQGFLRSKASGEPPVCMSANAFIAVKAAVQAALEEIGQTGYIQANAPFTPEVISSVSQLALSQFTL